MTTTSKPATLNFDQQLLIDPRSMQIRVQLNPMLQRFDLPLTAVQDVLVAFSSDLVVHQPSTSTEPLYLLPMLLLPDFIDLIVERLNPDAKTVALSYRDNTREAHRSVAAFNNSFGRGDQQTRTALAEDLINDVSACLLAGLVAMQQQPSTLQGAQ